MVDEPTRTIFIERGKEWQKVTFPASAKVTFGPLIPGRPEIRDNGSGLYLRIYKTKDHQLAVIPNVKQFRDEEVTFERPAGEGWAPITETDLRASGTVRGLAPGICPDCLSPGSKAASFQGWVCTRCGKQWTDGD